MANNSLKKSSMARLTEMLSNTKNAYFQNLIMDIYNLAKQTAEEIVREEIKNLKGQISIDAYLNGKLVSNKVITDQIINTIIRDMI